MPIGLSEDTTMRGYLLQRVSRECERIHAVLHQRLIHPTMDDLFTPRSRAWPPTYLSTNSKPPTYTPTYNTSN